MLKNRNILLGVSGGIAVYKAAALTSKLVQAGANVKVIMTKSACEFVSPLTFQALSRNEVYTNTFEDEMQMNKDAQIENPKSHKFVGKALEEIDAGLLTFEKENR
ncbi:DNA-directed RNA polymerase subunit omega [Bacillus licheniformis]|nr:DNA-directed RNA polymerase subunit omega [Bacillus licheniformis]